MKDYNICGVPISVYHARRIASTAYRIHTEHSNGSYEHKQDIIKARNELVFITRDIEQDRLECIGGTF